MRHITKAGTLVIAGLLLLVLACGSDNPAPSISPSQASTQSPLPVQSEPTLTLISPPSPTANASTKSLGRYHSNSSSG